MTRIFYFGTTLLATGVLLSMCALPAPAQEIREVAPTEVVER